MTVTGCPMASGSGLPAPPSARKVSGKVPSRKLFAAPTNLSLTPSTDCSVAAARSLPIAVSCVLASINSRAGSTTSNNTSRIDHLANDRIRPGDAALTGATSASRATRLASKCASRSRRLASSALAASKSCAPRCLRVFPCGSNALRQGCARI